MGFIVELNEVEEQKFSGFQKEHQKCVDARPMSTDGKHAFSLIVTPGGIGTSISARCNECGGIKDITDYSTF